MQFIKESRISATPAQVFAFHESAGAFRRLTPPWEKVEVVRDPGSIRPGSQVVLQTRLGPIPLKWVAEHTEYEPGRMFADTQIQGPFARWYHRHWFLDDGAGGTLLRDEVDYEPPMGGLGRWMLRDFLNRKLARLFEYRHDVTRRILESAKDQAGKT
ncbi:MAG: hypothetical protein NVSMB9_01140 [Isosphaeraceae bacterium]